VAQGYRIKGLASLQAKLKRLPAQIKSEAIQDIYDTAQTIVMKAGERAPVDYGVLKQSIDSQPKNGGLNYIVFVGAEYAPYIEWGTGTEVDVPTELKSYAIQFKGKGKKQVNMPAQPFFFNSYFEDIAPY